MNFFILGLPRSRTAWLANWFTQGDSLCMHDGWRWGLDAMKDASVGYEHFGNSDSSNGAHVEELLDGFPGCRMLLVERDPEESIAATIAMLNKWPSRPDVFDPGSVRDRVLALHEAHLELKESRALKTIPNCFSVSDLAEAQSWLTPGVPFNVGRWSILAGMNVQMNPSDYEVPA